jgi:MFS family permease
MVKHREEEFGEPHEHSRLLVSGVHHNPEDKKANKAVTLLKVVILLLALGDDLLDSPMARITEAVICYRHYEIIDPSKLLIGRDNIGPGAIGGVNELHCKLDAVQTELALLRGWQSLFDSIPGLLLAVPVGWAADQYGRKPFVLLALFGFFLQGAWPQFVTWFWQAFDIRAVWFSAFSGFMAGGIDTANTLFFVMVSDVASEARRAEVFFQLGAFSLGAMLIMPPLSAWLMRISSPWVPALTGTMLKLAGAAVFYFCPETLSCPEEKRRATMAVQQQRLDGSRGSRRVQADDDDNDTTQPESREESSNRSWVDRFRENSSFLRNDWRVAALIATFFGQAFLGRNRLLILQYLSKRYSISISEATLLMTARTIMMFLLFLVIFPYISKLMMQRQLAVSAQQKDLHLARASYVLWTIGWTLMGLAPSAPFAVVSMAIAALGQGTTLLTRSFLASLLQPHQVARAYSVVSIVEMIGSMLGAPALAEIFTLGLSLGSDWIGLPFIVIGLVSAASTAVMFAVGL